MKSKSKDKVTYKGVCGYSFSVARFINGQYDRLVCVDEFGKEHANDIVTEWINAQDIGLND